MGDILITPLPYQISWVVLQA